MTGTNTQDVSALLPRESTTHTTPMRLTATRGGTVKLPERMIPSHGVDITALIREMRDERP